MRGFTPYLVSSEALSATQPTLHNILLIQMEVASRTVGFVARHSNTGLKESSFFLTQLSQPSSTHKIAYILLILYFVFFISQ